MADFSHHATDEFGFANTAAERLARMQGIRPTESDVGYLPAPLVPGNDLHAVNELGFTSRDWLDANFENHCFNVKRENDRRRSPAIFTPKE